MKRKITLICAILCAGQLYGMEPERGRYVGLGDLPRETQAIIVAYLQTNDSLDGTIAAIKKASKGVGLVNKQLNAIVNEVYGIPKGFTALVHLLANKFNESTKDVAGAFQTSTSERYLELTNEAESLFMDEAIFLRAKREYLRNINGPLRSLTQERHYLVGKEKREKGYNPQEHLIQLIKDGLDVNFTDRTEYPESYWPSLVSLLIQAIESNAAAELIQILLDAGANPNYKGLKTALDAAQMRMSELDNDQDHNNNLAVQLLLKKSNAKRTEIMKS